MAREYNTSNVERLNTCKVFSTIGALPACFSSLPQEISSRCCHTGLERPSSSARHLLQVADRGRHKAPRADADDKRSCNSRQAGTYARPCSTIRPAGGQLAYLHTCGRRPMAKSGFPGAKRLRIRCSNSSGSRSMLGPAACRRSIARLTRSASATSATADAGVTRLRLAPPASAENQVAAVTKLLTLG